MDDSRTRFPEADAVARRGALQEGVDLVVFVDRYAHVLIRALIGPDQMVAVHRRRGRRSSDVGLRELQQRHLFGGVLHGDAVRSKADVALAGAQIGRRGIVKVAEQDLFGQAQRAAESLPDRLDISPNFRVASGDKFRSALDGIHRVSPS